MPGKRADSGQRRGATLAPAWREWIADNLLQGADHARVIEALEANGVPAREARAQVTQIGSSPALAVARRERRGRRRAEMVLQLLTECARSGGTEGRIDRTEGLEVEGFFSRYYARNQPVVIPGFARAWPAVARWSPEYFSDRFGDVEVEMTDGREADPEYDLRREKHFAKTTMRAFVSRVASVTESNDFYLIARNYNINRPELQGLFDDVDFTSGLLDPAAARRGSALWFGPAGTVTPLHHDTSNILFVQVYGRKRVALAAPTELGLLQIARAMYAGFDPEAPPPAQGPLRDVRVLTEVLAPGDALFIPVGWWHFVRALDVSISLAFNDFRRPNDFRWYLPGRV